MEKLSQSEQTRRLAVRIGARVRAARRARQPRLTLRQLGGERLSVAMLSRLERGDVVPSIDTLLYLSQQLDLSVAELLDPIPDEQQRRDAAIERAWALFHLHHYDDALRGFESVGDDPRGRVGAARALIKLMRLDTADALLARIEDATEGKDLALGELALARRALPQAVDLLGRAAQRVSAASDYPIAPLARLRIGETLLLLGRAQQFRGSHETALLSYRRALASIAGLMTTAEFAESLLELPPPASTAGAVAPAALAGTVALATYATQLSTTTLLALAEAQAALGRVRDSMASLRQALDAALARPLRESLESSGVPWIAEGPRAESHDDTVVGAFARLGDGYRRAGQFVEAEEQYRLAHAAALAAERGATAGAFLVRTATMWLQAGDRQRAHLVLQQAEAELLRADPISGATENASGVSLGV